MGKDKNQQKPRPQQMGNAKGQSLGKENLAPQGHRPQTDNRNLGNPKQPMGGTHMGGGGQQPGQPQKQQFTKKENPWKGDKDKQ